MKGIPVALTQFWWIVHKDVRCGFRSQHTVSRLLLWGIIVGFLLNYQIVLPSEHLPRIAASLCWITICFAAILNFGQSVVAEREEMCWESLLRYPVAPEIVFFAKLTTDAMLLGVLQLIVVPFFAITSGSAWLNHPVQLILVMLLADLGIASLGTLLAAGAARCAQHQSLFSLLVLPLLIPMMLAASEATRLVSEPLAVSQWQQWVQLLAVFAVVYTVLGSLLFPYLIED